MTGTLYGIGVGPGDPELLTLKAHRILREAYVVAYPQPDTGPSFARSIVDQFITAEQLEIPIIVPMDTKRFPAQEVYDAAATTIARHLDAGSNVVVLCEGDPFFYGSFMYLHERLAAKYTVTIVPGVSSVMAAAAAIGRPLAARNDVLTVIPGPLDDATIRQQLEHTDAAAIIKVGRHFARIRALIDVMGLMPNAAYAERVSLENQKISPLADIQEDTAPYFSMILIYKGAEKWVLDLKTGTTK
jgi:precorrin-2/cobalt-factor-2 C20-methyltransferase